MTQNKFKPKPIYYISAAVVLFFLILLIAIPRLLDPNLYRGQIIEAVKETTGRDLKITGKMTWSLFPLGFKLPNAELSNLPGFGPEPFATIENASIQAQLGPLFRKKLVVDAIIIDGLNLKIARDATGRKNWERTSPAQKTLSQLPAPKPIESNSGIDRFTIGKIVIRNATVIWKDLQSGDTYSLHNWNLQTGKIGRDVATDVKSSVDLHYGEKPQVSRMKLQALLQPLPRGFRLEQFDLTLDESHLKGTAEARTEPKTIWKFDLDLDEFDADRYLPESEGKQNVSKEDSQKQSPLVILGGMNGNGSLKIGKFKIMGIRMTNVFMNLRIKNGLFDLGPTTAALYDGTYNGHSTMDARGEKAKFQLNENLMNIQAGPFFKDLQVLQGFSGTGRIDVNLTAIGIKLPEFKKSTNGTVNLAISNGKIKGVNLEKLLQETKAISATLKGKTVSIPTKPTDETLFSRMTATLNFMNGVAQTNNIRIEGNVLTANGSGIIDILNETMNVKLKVTVAEPGGKNSLTVPVIAKGKLEAPQFGVDWSQALGAAVQENLQKQLQKGLKKLIQKNKKP
jgi:AsmA protein